MNRRTAYEYYTRLTGFQDFLINNYNATLDDIITKINQGSEDPYDILSGYVTDRVAGTITVNYANAAIS
jgi:hypothetical protein